MELNSTILSTRIMKDGVFNIKFRIIKLPNNNWLSIGIFPIKEINLINNGYLGNSGQVKEGFGYHC